MKLLNLDLENIYKGNDEGEFFYGVIFIDEDDIEQTNFELWRANDNEHLKKMIKDEYIGEYDEEDIEDEDSQYHYLSNEFDNDWDYRILWHLIGKILPVQT